jgi:hypothetical protein
MTSLVLDGSAESMDEMQQKLVNAQYDMALEEIRFVKLDFDNHHDGFKVLVMRLVVDTDHMRMQELHFDCCTSYQGLIYLLYVARERLISSLRRVSIRIDTSTLPPCFLTDENSILVLAISQLDLDLVFSHSSHWSNLHDFPIEHATILRIFFKWGLRAVRFESFAVSDDSLSELLTGLKEGTRPGRCKCTLASDPSGSWELSVCTNDAVGRESDLLFVEVLKPNPDLKESWYNSYLTEEGLKPKLRHWLDCNQVGRMLLHVPEQAENGAVSLRGWPLVLERVNGLFRLPEATAESRRANTIYHLLQGTQPTGTLLSALLREGRLGNEGE